MEKTIIPVAGGKGGVGKSLFVANLGIALAEAGHSTVTVDMDLGSSNQHTYLGMQNINPGIGDYLREKNLPIKDYLVETEVDNLRLLPGDGKMPFMANISYAQKIKLIREIGKLDARYILLDIGAGSSFNALDYFAMSDSGIIVTTLEYSAIMNVLVFFRNFLLRNMRQRVRKYKHLADILDKSTKDENCLTIEEITDRITMADRKTGEDIREMLQKCRPRIIFNFGEHPNELMAVKGLDQTIRERLSLEVDYIGFIFIDRQIRESVKKKLPLITSFRDSFASDEIISIARRITKFWNAPIENSLERLVTVAEKNYELRYEEF